MSNFHIPRVVSCCAYIYVFNVHPYTTHRFFLQILQDICRYDRKFDNFTGCLPSHCQRTYSENSTCFVKMWLDVSSKSCIIQSTKGFASSDQIFLTHDNFLNANILQMVYMKSAFTSSRYFLWSYNCTQTINKCLAFSTLHLNIRTFSTKYFIYSYFYRIYILLKYKYYISMLHKLILHNMIFCSINRVIHPLR